MFSVCLRLSCTGGTGYKHGLFANGLYPCLFTEKVGQTAPQRLPSNIPYMASCCYAEIGALNAESFCERVLSAGNLVVHEGNTLLPKDEVEMLTVLRINQFHGLEFEARETHETAPCPFVDT